MDSGYFLPIAPDECRRLLGDATVGRVGWVSSRGIQVLPVNYGVHGSSIVLQVAADSLLAELVQPVDVAFQVDDLDPATATGWSVLVQGATRPFGGEAALVVPRPWPPGDRLLGVEIVAHTYSGRSVSAD